MAKKPLDPSALTAEQLMALIRTTTPVAIGPAATTLARRYDELVADRQLLLAERELDFDTNVPSKRGFANWQRRLAKTCGVQASEAQDIYVTIIASDLENLKRANDDFSIDGEPAGREPGDALIKYAVTSQHEALKVLGWDDPSNGGGIAARVGGDEFMVAVARRLTRPEILAFYRVVSEIFTAKVAADSRFPDWYDKHHDRYASDDSFGGRWGAAGVGFSNSLPPKNVLEILRQLTGRAVIQEVMEKREIPDLAERRTGPSHLDWPVRLAGDIYVELGSVTLMGQANEIVHSSRRTEIEVDLETALAEAVRWKAVASDMSRQLREAGLSQPLGQELE